MSDEAKTDDATATLVALGLVVVLLTASGCVVVVTDSWRPLIFAAIVSVGVFLLGLVVDGVRNGRRSFS